MSLWLRQSTSMTVKMGPFVDDTDGATPLTSLTISQADIRISKNGGNIAQSNNSAGATHDELGYYDVPLDTTDTNTVGTLRVLISESGALPVWQDFMVVPGHIYTAMFGTSNFLADVRAIDEDVASQFGDSIVAKELSEPTESPAWPVTLADALAWITALARNKITQNSSESVLRNDADNADIASSAISESSGTFTRGEWT